MYVELHDRLNRVMRLPVSRVVVYDLFDNPIALAINMEGAHYIVAKATDKSFKSILKSLGIDKTVVIESFDSDNLKAL